MALIFLLAFLLPPFTFYNGLKAALKFKCNQLPKDFAKATICFAIPLSLALYSGIYWPVSNPFVIAMYCLHIIIPIVLVSGLIEEGQ